MGQELAGTQAYAVGGSTPGLTSIWAVLKVTYHNKVGQGNCGTGTSGMLGLKAPAEEAVGGGVSAWPERHRSLPWDALWICTSPRGVLAHTACPLTMSFT